ncbi:MAG: hypothetical protein ACNA7V_10840 [Bacteroidales bacterium]
MREAIFKCEVSPGNFFFNAEPSFSQNSLKLCSMMFMMILQPIQPFNNKSFDGLLLEYGSGKDILKKITSDIDKSFTLVKIIISDLV